jgi:hypothetical protein
MPAISHTLSGQYGGNYNQATVIIPNTQSTAIAGVNYPVSGVPAINQLIAGSVANVTAQTNQPTGTGTMGANGLIQYGLFINQAPSATQAAQGYQQFASVGSNLSTNIWLPTNIAIVNFDLHVVTTFSGATTPTVSIGAANANNGTATQFINAIAIPTTGAQQIQTQASTAYQANAFMNHVLNPTGVPTAASALNTSATVQGQVITQPCFNLTLQLGGSGIPATAALYIIVEYVYFGAQGPTGGAGV